MNQDRDSFDIQDIVRQAEARRRVVIGDAIAAGLTAIARAFAHGADALARRWRPKRPLAAR